MKTDNVKFMEHMKAILLHVRHLSGGPYKLNKDTYVTGDMVEIVSLLRTEVENLDKFLVDEAVANYLQSVDGETNP